jgi:hypothetical protein
LRTAGECPTCRAGVSIELEVNNKHSLASADEYKDARSLAVALVIIKVRQLLQPALPFTERLKCPTVGRQRMITIG